MAFKLEHSHVTTVGSCEWNSLEPLCSSTARDQLSGPCHVELLQALETLPSVPALILARLCDGGVHPRDIIRQLLCMK